MSASDLALQTRRRANLRHLIQSLDQVGVQSRSLQAEIIAGMKGPDLQRIIDGGRISDAFAREVEWAMHRPHGWLDRQPEDAPDD